MEPFASLEDLKGRLDWTLDADEERIANGALEDASDLARAYGKNWLDGTTAPRMVRTIVLAACARYMRNPEGYTTSRAGDETLGWSDLGEKAGSLYFTDPEQTLLSGMAGRSRLYSAPITAHGRMNTKAEGYVPVANTTREKPFPLFSNDTDPW